MLPQLLDKTIKDQLDSNDLDTVFKNLIEDPNVSKYDLAQAALRWNYNISEEYILTCILQSKSSYQNRFRSLSDFANQAIEQSIRKTFSK